MPVSSHRRELCPLNWMAGEGIDSVRLLRRRGTRWITEECWGIDAGEPPWDLVGDCEQGIILDASKCKRRAELRAASQCAGALISVGVARLAWMTSARSGWTPSESLIAALQWLALERPDPDEAVLGDREKHASTAAHDIRNQLSLALLRLERLEGASEEDLAAVRGALRSGRALCSAFLEGAQAHSDISLRSLLEEEIQGAIEAASFVDVSVSLRCGARMYAHAPEVAVRRFVQNALSNSLAASPKGSGLLVEVLSAGRGVLELAVEDQGGGLSAEEVMRCFRLGGSGRGSTGVGSESQLHAAEALGSSLTVRTAPGAGTRVSVRMRAARSDRPVAILLDQDATLRDQVMASLASAGWWVVPADSVSDAVGGLDRWDASLAVHRRGARGGSAGPLHRVASDLQIRCVELPAGDVGQGLPSPAEACV